MEKTFIGPVEPVATSGIDALGKFLDTDTEPMPGNLEMQLRAIMDNAFDGWLFHLRQRILGLNDKQWARLLRFFAHHGKMDPPPLWYCKFVAEMADAACCLSDSNPWKKHGKRFLKGLRIQYRR